MPDEPEKPAAPDRTNKPSLPAMKSSSGLLKPVLPPKPSAGAEEAFISADDDQRAWLRGQVINEIVDTEEDYVGNLDIIVEVWYRCLQLSFRFSL